jgi:hypothetical protein
MIINDNHDSCRWFKPSVALNFCEAFCCVFNPAMRAVLFLLFLSLADAARAGPQMEAKLKPDPSDSMSDEVIQRTDAFEAIGESDTDETEKDMKDETDEKDEIPAKFLEDLKHRPCCTCSLNWGSVVPKTVKFFFKFHKTCDRVGGSPTWSDRDGLTFCGPNCVADRDGKVCWKREYVKGGTRKLHKDTQDGRARKGSFCAFVSFVGSVWSCNSCMSLCRRLS